MDPQHPQGPLKTKLGAVIGVNNATSQRAKRLADNADCPDTK
jgi:hypothetical protein